MIDYAEVLTRIHQPSILFFFPLDDVQLLFIHNNCSFCLKNRFFGRLQTIFSRLCAGVFDALLKLKCNLLFLDYQRCYVFLTHSIYGYYTSHNF